MKLRALSTVAALVAVSCGNATPAPTGSNEYTLRGTSPYPERVTAAQTVRTLVLRGEDRAGADMRALRCGYSFMMFNVMRPSTQTPTAVDTSGDCRLYMTPPENDYTGQGWVCAGAISVSSGELTQTTGFCPVQGSAGPWEGDLRGCGGFFNRREATVSSVDEIGPDDQVTDLMGTVRFPTVPVIQQPTTLVVHTWPSSGPLTVVWNSLDATSAVVRIEPDGATRMGPTIVCTPRTNGRMYIEAGLIDRGGFRAGTSRLRVWSFRETAVQAEGHVWNLVGAVGSNVLLQPAR